jgi:hypothetical protein
VQQLNRFLVKKKTKKFKINRSIFKATKQLLDYFVSDKCIIGLLEVLKTSQIAQNRIYAATLLRKKIKNWKSLNQNEKNL